jgi:cell division control protein 45
LYYRLGAFHGKPSGCMYHLAHALRRNTNELLWLACVSLTDQFVHDRITNERYQAAVMELEQHINGSGNLDPSGAGLVVTLKDSTKIWAPETSRIAYEDEPRLMLLREWSLFDSMLCSSYVATRLKTWTDNGLKKLKLLLARMGFALADCQMNLQSRSAAGRCPTCGTA